MHFLKKQHVPVGSGPAQQQEDEDSGFKPVPDLLYRLVTFCLSTEHHMKNMH